MKTVRFKTACFRTLVFILALCLVVSFSGCDKSGGSSDKGEGTSASDKEDTGKKTTKKKTTKKKTAKKTTSTSTSASAADATIGTAGSGSTGTTGGVGGTTGASGTNGSKTHSVGISTTKPTTKPGGNSDGADDGDKPVGTTQMPTTTTTTTTKVDGVTIPGDLGKGTIYYVSSSTGKDSNSGKSPDKALKSVAEACKLNLKAGDSILLKRGDTFKGAQFKLAGEGEAKDGKWITIDAYGSGENPLLTPSSKNQAAITLSPTQKCDGFRIRNLTIDGYLIGIVSSRDREKTLDGLEISNCTIRNITMNRKHVIDGGDMSGIQFPSGLDAGYGIYLRNVRNATLANLTIRTTDIPVRIFAEKTLLDNLDVYDSRITGVMLYGAESFVDYDTIVNGDGGIVFRNSRVFHTGTVGLGLGTTGVLVENTKACTIDNVEIAYTTNGVGDNDGCAIVWEQRNVECVIQNVYAHDNDGPFLLAMEHPESLGQSKFNKVINCLSVNNGKRDHTTTGSFMDQSSYPNSYQRIVIRDCVNVGMPGSAPYTYWATNKDLFSEISNKYNYLENFTSGLMSTYCTFDQGEVGALSVSDGVAVKNSHLSIPKGGQARTNYSGSNYTVNTWLKGSCQLAFMSKDADTGYFWSFQDGKIIAQKVAAGKATKLKEITVKGLKVSQWYRARVEVDDGTIRTYVDDRQVDTLKDTTYTSGKAGVYGTSATQVDEFFLYKYTPATCSVQVHRTGTIATGGYLQFYAAGGASAYNQPEVNWTPNGAVSTYWYRAHGTGRMEIGAKGAAIEKRNMNCNVNGGYNKVRLYLTNATTSDKVYIDFSTDGGRTWHTKAVTVRRMSDDGVFPFKALWPEFTMYTVDMSDMVAWKGTINGFRLRTEASSGFLSFKYVAITK